MKQFSFRKKFIITIKKLQGFRVTLFAFALLCFAVQASHAAKVFSGFAGFRSDIFIKDPKYNFRVGLTDFFNAQFTFKENIFLRTAFSLQLADLAQKNIFFSGIDAHFFIDEVSFVLRSNFEHGKNYFSVFVGNYEASGSDIFLRRYFGIKPIASKFTDTWTGNANPFTPSTFSIGLSDIIQFSNQPLAFAFYASGNANIMLKAFVLNADFRFAGAYRFFAFDLVAGLNVPIYQKDSVDAKAISYINSLYAHTALTMLLGNNYSPISNFLQVGAFDLPLKRDKKDTNKFSLGKNIYILEELRSRINAFETALTFFSLPPFSAKRLLLTNDTLGFNLQFGVTEIQKGLQSFSIGTNATVSFPEKNFTDLFSAEKAKALFKKLPTFAASQYVKMQTPYGELATMLQLNITHLIDKKYAEAFKLNVGWTSKF